MRLTTRRARVLTVAALSFSLVFGASLAIARSAGDVDGQPAETSGQPTDIERLLEVRRALEAQIAPYSDRYDQATTAAERDQILEEMDALAQEFIQVTRQLMAASATQ